MTKMHESSEILKLRTKASSIIEAEYVAVQNQLKRSLLDSVGVSGFDNHVDNLVTRLQNHHQSQAGKILKEAYLLALTQGENEVRFVSVVNQRDEVAVENAWGDLWRKASGKAKEAIKSVSDWVKKAVRKALPKKDSSKPLTAKEIKTAQEITEEILTKAKNKEKSNLQDEITRALAAGKLDSYETAGITTVMAQIETVNDNRRCKKCGDLDGVILPIEQARELLPCHPHCRCFWKLPPSSSPTGKKNQPTGKGGNVSKKIRREQRLQEKKAMKLRDRLDRAYKQKQAAGKKRKTGIVHNEAMVHHVHLPWEMKKRPSDDSCPSYYLSEMPDFFHEETLILVLQDVKLGKTKNNYRVLDRYRLLSPDAPVLSFGHVLRVEGYDEELEETVLSLIGDLSGGRNDVPQKSSDLKFDSRMISLLPDSINDYPYTLATNEDSSVVATMLNPKRGIVEIFNKYSIVMDLEEVMKFCLGAGLCLNL